MIYITGDTHGSIDIHKLKNKAFKDSSKLTKNDYVIVLGDFGVIWDNSNEQKYWLKWLDNKHFTTLFIDGNHESFDLLYKYPVEEWNGGKIHRINDSVYHLMRGQVFNIDGLKFFTFGGATSIDKLQRTEYISWWRQELPTTKELDEGINNLEKNNWQVDYVLSHCCSANMLKVLYNYRLLNDYDTDILNKYFNMIEDKVDYKHWYFGHYHQDIKNITNKHTVLYNLIEKIK